MIDTKIYKVPSIYGGEELLQSAADTIAKGGLVVFPTETVYGLGADGLSEKAVADIFAAKGRPADNPLILHICDSEQLALLAEDIPQEAIKLALNFWPGPLTLVLKRSSRVPDIVTAGLDTVAIRFPDHLVARELIRRSGTVIAAPSANRSGSPSPTTAEHCIADLMGRVDVIIDSGACKVGVESTVVSFEAGTARILRPGGITREQIAEVLGAAVVDPAVTNPLKNGEKAASPGMKYKHYAPKAKVILVKAGGKAFAEFVNGRDEEGLAAICFDEDLPDITVPAFSLGSCTDYEEQASRLYAALRAVDEHGAKTVYTHCPDTDGVGLAVYNRLLRAAAFEVITLAE